MAGSHSGTYRGKYAPTNKQKYKGNSEKVQYRSSWELAVMKWLDFTPLVKRWSSEEIVIPYRDSSDQMRTHRYFMDFYVEFENGITYLWEIKPYEQTQIPLPPKRVTPATSARHLEAVLTYKKNKSKWITAKKFAEDRGWVFKVLTEKALRKYGILITDGRS